MREVMAMTAAIAGLIGLSREWDLPYRDFDFESLSETWSLVSLYDLSRPICWPSLMALACMLFILSWLLLKAADDSWRLFAGCSTLANPKRP
jgi:hypothetical protein